MMKKVIAKVKGTKQEVVFDYKTTNQAKEFIANKFGVKPNQVNIVKTESA